MNRRRLVFFLFLLAGLGLINYPFVSQWVNRRNQSSIVWTYAGQTQSMPAEEKLRILSDARAYNAQLAQTQQQLTDGFTGAQIEDAVYESLLNPGGDGVMGYLEIPAIEVLLPVFHGTDAYALENGAGHLPQSSLPVGGADTHAVLSAHTGLASKALFTDLDQLQTGDLFRLHILDETLSYEVCAIETVLPYETESLAVEPGRDLVTLVTCTPYGVNSHRLLVTGERVQESGGPSARREEPQPVRAGKWKWEQAIFAGSVLIVLVSGFCLLRPERKGGKQSHG